MPLSRSSTALQPAPAAPVRRGPAQHLPAARPTDEHSRYQTDLPQPGAATRRVRDQLTGPSRHGRVIHVGDDAVYVQIRDRCIGLLSSNAVHVPCGIRTIAGATAARVSVGDPAATGHGRLQVAGLVVVVARLVELDIPWSIEDAERAHADLLADGPVRTTELPAEALVGLTAGDPDSVGSLLGRGSGLTPLGDDVLSGWLVTARCVGHPGLESVAGRIGQLARRTTTLSAELLRCACDGEAPPPLRIVLAALAAGDRAALARAIDGLRAVGHTSGTGLLLGCRLAVAGVATGAEVAG
ncbi:oxamate carbamoyltransferase subunit AllH family protein [Nocardioides terrisoli]|uniref:DUF2877 domain-containing protein n=1 Tax=Nocardioides terrisoli TaxID=3388267 RepID=UPI00287BBE59|nr:DUF2877 domain-containing protein [Nocardioides marmorisolisilvae]